MIIATLDHTGSLKNSSLPPQHVVALSVFYEGTMKDTASYFYFLGWTAITLLLYFVRYQYELLVELCVFNKEH